jgi:hypothetical protein
MSAIVRRRRITWMTLSAIFVSTGSLYRNFSARYQPDPGQGSLYGAIRKRGFSRPEARPFRVRARQDDQLARAQ